MATYSTLSIPANGTVSSIFSAHDAANHTASTTTTRFFWGQPDSLIDWCELNFVHSPYVAEYYNTMTHVPAAFYCLAAAVLMAIPRWWPSTIRRPNRRGSGLHSTPLETRYQVTVLGLMLVCVGSSLFHGTLRYWAQLLDEIPMLFVLGSFTYCLNRRRGPAFTTYNLSLAGGLSAIIVVSIALYVYWEVYHFFVGCYIAGTISVIGQSILLAMDGAGLDVKLDPCGVQYRRKLFARALAFYLLASSCWVVERLTCPHQNAPLPICQGTVDSLGLSPLGLFCYCVPYLHAVWHVFSILGAYELVLFVALATGDNKKRHITRCALTHMGLVV